MPAGASRPPRRWPHSRICESREFELALDSPAPYERFARDCERIRDELSGSAKRSRAEGKAIHVYGASTKGNTILQYAGLDRA